MCAPLLQEVLSSSISFNILLSLQSDRSKILKNEHDSTRRNNSLPLTRIDNKQSFNYTTNNPLLYLQQTVGNQVVQNLINSRKIQTKLRVSKPSDACEEEADLVASQIMGASNLPEESYLIKRSSVDKKVHRKCKGCEDDEKSKTRFIRRKRKSSSFEISDIAVKDISQTFSHEGPPLETTIREFMESKFAYDFSGVRIHADEEAARSAELANALAYTVGNDIVFGKGQYQPSTFEGKRLLAHELAHVIQQETTFVQNNPPLVVPFDVYEHDSVSNFTEHYLGDYTRRTRIGRIMSFVNTSEELANGYDANFDDGFLYQANGTTTCTFPAGTATSTVTNPDPCTADCTSRHEGVTCR